jgi:hypothetical protein
MRYDDYVRLKEAARQILRAIVPADYSWAVDTPSNVPRWLDEPFVVLRVLLDRDAKGAWQWVISITVQTSPAVRITHIDALAWFEPMPEYYLAERPIPSQHTDGVRIEIANAKHELGHCYEHYARGSWVSHPEWEYDEYAASIVHRLRTFLPLMV